MPKSRSIRKRRSLAQIAAIMGKFEGCNLSSAEIARRVGVSVPTVYQWKRRLEFDGNTADQAHRGSMVRVVAANWPPVAPAPAPVASGSISLVLGSGLLCRVDPGFDEQTLLRVVKLLPPTDG
jgi:hypothetical protein